MATRKKFAGFHPQPDGKIRRSQVVTTFGPGAMVDLIDDAVVVGGLDFWKPAGTPIAEPRLRDQLADELKKHDRKLSRDQPFFEPPAGEDGEPVKGKGILALEFPRWFVCQNPTCRALARSDHLQRVSGRYVHACDTRDRKSAACVPVRFVAACTKGHLDEFAWSWFVHTGTRCSAPQLRLIEGATGDFGEVVVRCRVCGSSRPLIDAKRTDAVNPRCSGRRPWLGADSDEACDERVRLLVRTASNGYFSQVVSALSLPDRGGSIAEAVEACWDVLQAASPENLPAFRQIPKVRAALGAAGDPEVLAAVRARKEGRGVVRPPLRTEEFQQFTAAPAESAGELPQPKDRFFARHVKPKGGLPAGASRLVLASKLREVRVQVGFSRFEPHTQNLQGEFDLGVGTQVLSVLRDWLPAVEVLGEGVFLELDEAAVRAWEARAAVVARGKELLAGHAAWQERSGAAFEYLGTRFYMLHSLSHLLMSALSLECGYAASALRERIYCAPATDPVPMAAILISTGTPGAEGTLGGLVEEGRRIRDHLRRAFELGRLCSNDPVCAHHSPKSDLSERHLEGAACHGCLFVAESSCEWFNRYLDRALVVPTLRHRDAAFFAEAP